MLKSNEEQASLPPCDFFIRKQLAQFRSPLHKQAFDPRIHLTTSPAAQSHTISNTRMRVDRLARVSLHIFIGDLLSFSQF